MLSSAHSIQWGDWLKTTQYGQDERVLFTGPHVILSFIHENVKQTNKKKIYSVVFIYFCSLHTVQPIT